MTRSLQNSLQGCWEGGPYFLFSFSSVIGHPPFLLPNKTICFLHFLSCNGVISYWYIDMFSNRTTHNSTEIWWLFCVSCSIVHHSYSIGIYNPLQYLWNKMYYLTYIFTTWYWKCNQLQSRAFFCIWSFKFLIVYSLQNYS